MVLRTKKIPRPRADAREGGRLDAGDQEDGPSGAMDYQGKPCPEDLEADSESMAFGLSVGLTTDEVNHQDGVKIWMKAQSATRKAKGAPKQTWT